MNKIEKIRERLCGLNTNEVKRFNQLCKSKIYKNNPRRGWFFRVDEKKVAKLANDINSLSESEAGQVSSGSIGSGSGISIRPC